MSPRESTAMLCGATKLPGAVVDAHPPEARLADRPVALRGLPLVPPQFGDVGAALGIEHDVGRPLGVRPLAQVLAVRAEDLDAVALAVAHEDAPVRRGADAVGEIELARPRAGHAPRALALPARRELMDAAVAVAV